MPLGGLPMLIDPVIGSYGPQVQVSSAVPTTSR
jgi:hypothetical protein